MSKKIRISALALSVAVAGAFGIARHAHAQVKNCIDYYMLTDGTCVTACSYGAKCPCSICRAV